MSVDENMENLDAYFNDLKERGQLVPSWRAVARPNIKVISAASRVGYRHLLKPPYSQRITLAVQEIGLEPTQVLRNDRRDTFERNCKLIGDYLVALKAGGNRLPEDPEREGHVFFAQVEIESGVNRDALTLKGIETAESYQIQLRKLVNSAKPDIGLEVRVLPKSMLRQPTPIIYGQLFKRGTSERKRELEGNSSGRQQLYNTRLALNQFIRSLGLTMNSPVGQELTIEFEDTVEGVSNKLDNSGSKKKFRTGIRWWWQFYQRLLKEQSIPDEFHKAFSHLVDASGLTHSILSKLIGVSRKTVSKWYLGTHTPHSSSLDALSKAETVFKLPAGTLVNKVPRSSANYRLRATRLPHFLRETPDIARKVKTYLPDNFCDLTVEKQKELVNTVLDEITANIDPFTRRQTELQKLPYRLMKWPKRLEKEFEDMAAFKMAERPPIGMKRNGTWRPDTKEMMRHQLGYLFGSMCLPPDAADVRLQGLGVSPDALTMALLVCPKLIDWCIRFKCERRNGYTNHTINLLNTIKSMIRAKTGWIRQQPSLAQRLRPISLGGLELVSRELILEACSDWDAACERAISDYNHFISEIRPLVCVARDPFHRIEGIVETDDPMKALGFLLKEMKDDMPDPNTRPAHRHIMVRNCAIVVLLATTGLRRKTLSKLDYTGDDSGNLYLRNGRWILSAPRHYFKEENSPYFGPLQAQQDYHMELPNVFGLAEILSEYLNVSRPYLMGNYYPECKENPLFVNSYKGVGARLKPWRVTSIYFNLTEKYLAEKKLRGTGLTGVKKHGCHAVRHLRGTKAMKETGSVQIAADAIHTSERMARIHYGRFSPKDRNRRVNDALFKEQYDNL